MDILLFYIQYKNTEKSFVLKFSRKYLVQILFILEDVFSDYSRGISKVNYKNVEQIYYYTTTSVYIMVY